MCSGLLLNQKGASQALVLVTFAIIGIVATVIITIGNQKRKISQQMNVGISANLIKEKLVGVVLSPKSWQVTQSHNHAAFSGSTSPSGSSSSGTAAPKLDLYLPDSTVAYYESKNPAAGFDLKGNVCNTFSASGNDDCPFHYDISLVNHVFQNANWIDTVHFELQFRPASLNMILNTSASQYSFDLTRNFNDQSVETACVSVHGNYDPNTNSCSIKLTDTVAACGAGETYRGPLVNASHTKCDPKRTVHTTCSGSQVIKGFNSNGNPICGAPL